MSGPVLYSLLGLLAVQAVAQSSDIILNDTYFYGLSPPSYPSPNASLTGPWAAAYAKASAFVGQLTLDEKVYSARISLASSHFVARNNVG